MHTLEPCVGLWWTGDREPVCLARDPPARPPEGTGPRWQRERLLHRSGGGPCYRTDSGGLGSTGHTAAARSYSARTPCPPYTLPTALPGHNAQQVPTPS